MRWSSGNRSRRHSSASSILILRSAIDEEAQFVGYGHGDIAAALHDLFVDVDQRLSDLRETEDLMLTAIADKLAVADDPKSCHCVDSGAGLRFTPEGL